MKRKIIQILLGIGALAYAVYCINDFGHMAQQRKILDLESRLAAVTNGLDNVQAGIPRAESFLRALKAVDVSNAPIEVKNALQDYIAEVEGSLEAVKAGRDTSAYDLSMPKSKERLRLALQNAGE